MEHPGTLWTIGHSTREIQDFLALLLENKIAVLADVRAFPGSRKYPWFNKDHLTAALGQAGIAYRHFPELGGRRKAAENSRNTIWRHPSFRAYADYMETPEFEQAIAGLMELAAAQKTCIMCSEAVWWRCHRSLIADYFKSKGWRVLHILSPGKAEEHPYTSPAKIDGGKLWYGGE